MKRYIVEKDFEYKGFRCIVTFGYLGTRYGYVGVSKDNECYECDYINLDVDCHGGLTYSGGGTGSEYPVKSDLWWFGFDCNHCYDGRDIKLAIKEFPKYSDALLTMAAFKAGLPVRSTEYVSQSCRGIVDRLLKEGYPNE